MRVVATRKYFQRDIDIIERALPKVEFIFPDELSNEFLLEQCDLGVDVFLGPPPPKKVLKKALPRLKLIQIPWTGVDNVDFSDACELQIPCANSHSNSVVVAEMAVSLLLELLKKLALHDRDLRNGIWHRPGDESGFYPPRKLSGLNIGFFGYGAINKVIHKMLTGFDASFIACVNKVRDINGVSRVYGGYDLNSFLKNIDVLFVGAPLTERTEGIFDLSTLKNLGENSYIINVSRSKLFVESDLFELLKKDMVSGAALDVWWQNPKRGESRCFPSLFPFVELDNVVLSPHRSGYSEGELPHLEGAITNIDRLAQGKAANCLIDFSRGY